MDNIRLCALYLFEDQGINAFLIQCSYALLELHGCVHQYFGGEIEIEHRNIAKLLLKESTIKVPK